MKGSFTKKKYPLPCCHQLGLTSSPIRKEIIQWPFLLKCQHYWLNWLDKDAEVYSLDFSKTLDFVSHQIVCNKLKLYNINPHVIHCIINFLSNRKQRSSTLEVKRRMNRRNRIERYHMQKVSKANLKVEQKKSMPNIILCIELN